MMEDRRTAWQKHVGVNERQHRPKLMRTTTETTETGAVKERVEYTDGRVDNYYTVPTKVIEVKVND